MFKFSIPSLSTLTFEPIPEPPSGVSPLLPGGLKTIPEAKRLKTVNLRVATAHALITRLYLHGQLKSLDTLPSAVQQELAQTEALTWALLCRLYLCMSEYDSAADTGHMVLEQLPNLPVECQEFATHLVKVLVLRVERNDFVDEIDLLALHECQRETISRLIQVQKAITRARDGELPGAISMLLEVTKTKSDVASMIAWYTQARIFEAQQYAWEELQCCMGWKDSLTQGIAAYAGQLEAKGVRADDVVDMGLRLITLLRSADRHPESDALIEEFERAGFGDKASIFRSHGPRAAGWSLKMVDDAGPNVNSLAHEAIYNQLIAGRNKHACVGLRRLSHDDLTARAVDPDCNPKAELITALPDMLSGFGLEVLPDSLMEKALSTYQWILLRDQEQRESGLLIGLLSSGHKVDVTALRCIAFPTRVEQGRDKAWLKHAVDLLISEFDPVKRRGALSAVDNVLQRLAPAGRRVRVTRI